MIVTAAVIDLALTDRFLGPNGENWIKDEWVGDNGKICLGTALVMAAGGAADVDMSYLSDVSDGLQLPDGRFLQDWLHDVWSNGVVWSLWDLNDRASTTWTTITRFLSDLRKEVA